MNVLLILTLFAISTIGIFYGLGQMVNKKFNVDELYWLAEGKTNSEAQKQERIRQLDERGKLYSIKYYTSFSISIITFLLGIIYTMRLIKRRQ